MIGICSKCGAKMVPLFNFLECPNSCDKRQQIKDIIEIEKVKFYYDPKYDKSDFIFQMQKPVEIYNNGNDRWRFKKDGIIKIIEALKNRKNCCIAALAIIFNNKCKFLFTGKSGYEFSEEGIKKIVDFFEYHLKAHENEL